MELISATFASHRVAPRDPRRYLSANEIPCHRHPDPSGTRSRTISLTGAYTDAMVAPRPRPHGIRRGTRFGRLAQIIPTQASGDDFRRSTATLDRPGLHTGTQIISGEAFWDGLGEARLGMAAVRPTRVRQRIDLRAEQVERH
jgi:hypothetical protein